MVREILVGLLSVALPAVVVLLSLFAVSRWGWLIRYVLARWPQRSEETGCQGVPSMVSVVKSVGRRGSFVGFKNLAVDGLIVLFAGGVSGSLVLRIHALGDPVAGDGRAWKLCMNNSVKCSGGKAFADLDLVCVRQSVECVQGVVHSYRPVAPLLVLLGAYMALLVFSFLILRAVLLFRSRKEVVELSAWGHSI